MATTTDDKIRDALFMLILDKVFGTEHDSLEDLERLLDEAWEAASEWRDERAYAQEDPWRPMESVKTNWAA